MDKTLTLERLLLMEGMSPDHLVRTCKACAKEGKYVVFIKLGAFDRYVYYIRCGCMTYYRRDKRGRVREEKVAVPRDMAVYMALMWS